MTLDAMVEVHVFQGTAEASARTQRYLVGEERPIIVLLRQPHGTNHDWDTAARKVAELGWRNIYLESGKTLTDPEQLNKLDHLLKQAYERALENGCHLLVYPAMPKHGVSET